MDIIILGRWWNIGRPAPMVKCPTSEFPSSPHGRPVAVPEACSVVNGKNFSISRNAGISAYFHVESGVVLIPNPSSIRSTTGLYLLAIFDFISLFRYNLQINL